VLKRACNITVWVRLHANWHKGGKYELGNDSDNLYLLFLFYFYCLFLPLFVAFIPVLAYFICFQKYVKCAFANFKMVQQAAWKIIFCKLLAATIFPLSKR
jgi:hypothetical protein